MNVIFSFFLKILKIEWFDFYHFSKIFIAILEVLSLGGVKFDLKFTLSLLENLLSNLLFFLPKKTLIEAFLLPPV